MDLKQQHKPTTISASTTAAKKQNPDAKLASSTASYLSKYFSSLHLNHKLRSSHKHKNQEQQQQNTVTKDTLLQAKSLASSAILDSSSSCPQHRKETCKVMTTKEAMSKDKPKKPSKAMKEEEKSTVKYLKGMKEGEKSRVKKSSKEEKNSVKKSSMDVRDLRSSYDGNIDVKKISAMVRDRACVGNDIGRRVSMSLEMRGGRRRSFCDSNVELAGIFASNGVKVVAVDMPPFMQIHAVDCARKTFDSLEKFTSKSLALTLKKEFDGVYGPAWHCIVGKSFGSFVTHSVGGFMYFSMDQKMYILLFKTTVHKAE